MCTATYGRHNTIIVSFHRVGSTAIHIETLITKMHSTYNHSTARLMSYNFVNIGEGNYESLCRSDIQGPMTYSLLGESFSTDK